MGMLGQSALLGQNLINQNMLGGGGIMGSNMLSKKSFFN